MIAGAEKRNYFMGKIVYLMGKSSSGKDTIYKRLCELEKPKFQTIPLYTTRPIRDGEKEGVEYHFTDEAGYQEQKKAGNVVEERTYHTVMGDWHYYTVLKDVDLGAEDTAYLMIGTLESFIGTKKAIGEENIIPIYIELDDGVRLSRALTRERSQEKPQYEEMCRRFLADAQDFSEEKIVAAGITKRFQNEDLDACLGEILEYLNREL